MNKAKLVEMILGDIEVAKKEYHEIPKTPDYDVMRDDLLGHIRGLYQMLIDLQDRPNTNTAAAKSWPTVTWEDRGL